MIQLSDHRIHAQQQSEPRMEAIVFVDGTKQAARAMRQLAVAEDYLGVVRVSKQLEAMCLTAYEEIDRLTMQFGHPEDAA